LFTRSSPRAPNLLLACENNISAATGGGVCGRVGASTPSDFTGFAAAGFPLGGCGRFVSRIPSAGERCVLAVEWAAYAKAAAVEGGAGRRALQAGLPSRSSARRRLTWRPHFACPTFREALASVASASLAVRRAVARAPDENSRLGLAVARAATRFSNGGKARCNRRGWSSRGRGRGRRRCKPRIGVGAGGAFLPERAALVSSAPRDACKRFPESGGAFGRRNSASFGA
jgi:hypothetical protein